MGRSLKYEIPGTDPRVPLDVLATQGWSEVFGSSADAASPTRVVEIGFGRGEFLLAMAEQAPQGEFVGVEVSFKRTLKMARKVARAGLSNVRLVEGRAERAIQSISPPGGLSAIWVNFSDPWPKSRHAHRRLLQPAFVRDAAGALETGGVLYVATDDVPYAHQVNAVLEGEPALENVYSPWPFLSEVQGRMRTGYELQWREEGRPMHFFAYRSRSEPAHTEPDGGGLATR